ncbi:unnamed protein product [Adineta ricciae]|uniref:Uncharacterized protein n=1 Tax=Adineta ricciae TaxID=249248 RepID=A0A813MPF1_ADIRI|nr:unnamed protein product [Adineta ricciae]
MQSFSVYCLLLCSMIIFAAHQINAMETTEKFETTFPSEITSERAPEKVMTLRDVLIHKTRGAAAASSVSDDIAASAVAGDPDAEASVSVEGEGVDSVQCGNGQITIAKGTIACK